MRKEVENVAGGIARKLNQQAAEVKQLLDEKRVLSKGDREWIVDVLKNAGRKLSSDLPFLNDHINVDSGQENGHADIMTLIYERAQERYRTLEINDTDFRTEKMQKVLSDREMQTEFDEGLYLKLVTRIVVYKNNTAEVVFLNGCSIKIEYQSDNP